MRIAESLKNGLSVDKIYKLTGIDQWFLYRIKNIVDAEKEFVSGNFGVIPRSAADEESVKHAEKPSVNRSLRSSDALVGRDSAMNIAA